MRLPETGEAWPALREALLAAKARDHSWRRGRMAVFFYYLDEALEQVGQDAYRLFWTENNLGQRAFPRWPSWRARWWRWGWPCSTRRRCGRHLHLRRQRKHLPGLAGRRGRKRALPGGNVVLP
jgi:hypothetical protein